MLSYTSISSATQYISNDTVMADIKPPTIKSNKCGFCNIKLSVVQQGIKCKCDKSFCGNCRYPEKHQCSYNFKQEGKNRLRDELVEVRGEKLNRI